MTRDRHSVAAAVALAATMIGFAGVTGEGVSMLLITFGLIVAITLRSRPGRRPMRGNR
jgi:hypothetical protein